MNSFDTYAESDKIIFGRSQAMQVVRKTIAKVCSVPVPVLLQGEAGTGKELIGYSIHRFSPWRDGPFTKIDAGETFRSYAMTETLSRLLGLPNATTNRPAGTLFVEEVGDLAPAWQIKLLAFLLDNPGAQWKGGDVSRPTFPRILCSSRGELEQAVIAGRLRIDLFYHINVVTIQLPRLRERKEDIPDLATYFCQVFSREKGRNCPSVPDELLLAFSNYDWPGNIRELRNCMSAYVNSNGDAALAEALLFKSSPALGTGVQGANNAKVLRAYARQAAAEAEREMILKVLSENHWNRKDAAKALQISYHTLLYKLKQTKLEKYGEPQVSLEPHSVQRGPLP